MEGKGFRLFSKTMQPRFDIPSRFTVWEIVWNFMLKRKKRLRIALKGQWLCLTIFTWT